MITNVLAAFFFSYYFVNIYNAPIRIKKIFKLNPARRIKPLDCVTCLSVYVAAILFFCPFELTQFIAVIFCAGYFGNFIK